MLWSLGNEKTFSPIFTKTSKRGVPLVALCASMLGAILALISSVVAADTVYLVLVSISGLAVVIVWMVIAITQIRFRKSFWLVDVSFQNWNIEHRYFRLFLGQRLS